MLVFDEPDRDPDLRAVCMLRKYAHNANAAASRCRKTYHYPPDVLELMVDGLSKLYRSKPALVTFFRGAGVSVRVLGDLSQRVSARDSPRKVEIVREVLTRLNEDGDASLAARREVIKRIVEHEDYSSAWPDDVAGAKAFVADLRKLQRAKDALTKN